MPEDDDMKDQIKELTKTVMEVRIDLAKIDTKFDGIKDMQQGIKDMQHKDDDHGTRLTSVEALAIQSSKRMDRIDKIFGWIITAIGAGFIAAIVTFIVKGGLTIK